MKITFVGHSTVLMEEGKTTILTDPLFVSRILLLKRKSLPGLQLKEIEKLDAVTISHAHTDHLNFPSLKMIKKHKLNPQLIVPAKVKPVVNFLNFKTTELTWEQSIQAGDFKITAVEVNHGQGRFLPCSKTGVSSYIFSAGKINILVAGDVDFGDNDYFERIGKQFDLNVVMLPVGGMRKVAYYEKRTGKKGVHIDPATAYQLFLKSQAKIIIPIHWGAISLSGKNVDEAPMKLLEIAARDNNQDKVVILQPGDELIF
ncbi:MAG: MBL fold metallo-hydrolase [Deltaproteobacteria bacterium]|jgi:L-ascorbate metabolism protein UlaG (beta-lactamase superfamily)|nr:MBL fold metallo-hydrolase [Deltaproteobacteria bacterium]